jgi:hypothetical protein
MGQQQIRETAGTTTAIGAPGKAATTSAIVPMSTSTIAAKGMALPHHSSLAATSDTTTNSNHNRYRSGHQNQV